MLNTSCHSVYTPYAYSADSLSKCIYIHTQVSWFRMKTLNSVMEKNYMFLKAYALNGIEPSLTHILNCNILYFTHTHLRYTSKHNTDENVTHTHIYIYIYIYMFSYKILPFVTGKEHTFVYLDLSLYSIRAANPITGLQLKNSCSGSAVAL
jgi:hypothetical protein